MSGRITTHVLDLAGGKPVNGMTMELWYLGKEAESMEAGEMPQLMGCYQTNTDGRADTPLLEGEAVLPGVYELIFAAGRYFRQMEHLSAIKDSIFDFIPIRFHIKDAAGHYHVPLLVAPGGYSTYRGS
ncbi:5-hydroxyisourate hydrolase [Paenibacillus endophyticus]|uniref:5-hydroxyisourate hydrolase n=1 Tax=Paenibacillus endophyticus TaxID=1294268 RepID=A0A7W5C694_9BACL|nr:hydroxyisourate hydrolase [Paenibacillus endophyticus]MBB3151953.1 5-hydroxyisourate hydrolase [Paenibacillus endophyticus]